MNAEELKREIATAWADEKYPGDDNNAYDLSGRHLECNAVAKFFCGKHWRRITLDSLSHAYPGDGSACLSFMSPAAYQFYLPAYMLIAIDSYNEADVTADAAMFSLTPWREPESDMYAWWKTKVTGFTFAQREAIVAFLKYLLVAHSEEWVSHSPKEALVYWETGV